MMTLLMHLRRESGISCARVQKLVQSYLDGELTGPDVAKLANHLHQCRRCGVEAATYERIKAALAAPPPADSVARLQAYAASIPNQLPEP